ncbi:MAG TPA: fused MFS/spermidine synthase, partial [Vicinamibacteria bacterium]|nr:fused MFS/spermidine synthase [Vicinamibacteria bacterium]
MVLYFLFFLSGLAALLFETLWFRLASVVFGNSVWASSVVLAGFMAGLALGSFAASRGGPWLRRPIRAYARLELAVALGGLLLVLILPHLSALLAPVLHRLIDRPLALQVLRLGAAFGLMLVPAGAMGATLPVLVKALTARGSAFGPALGTLYGWNTFGAVAGALAGEQVLIGSLGLRGTGGLAAGLDLLAAGLAWRLSRESEAGPEPPAAGAAAWRLSPAPLAVLFAAALSGGILLALEVVWFRLLVPFVGSTSAVFAVLLAVVLSGIGLGGWLAAGSLRSKRGAEDGAPAVAFAAGASTLVTYAWLDHVLPSDWASGTWDIAVLASSLMLPTALLSGVLFTLLGRALRKSVADDPAAAGWLTVANTVGAAAGSLAGGFLLLPRWGIEASLRGLAAAYAVVGLAALLAARPVRRGPAGGAAAAAVVLGIAFTATPQGEREATYRARVVKRWAHEGAQPIAWREGLTESLVYLARPLLGEPLSYRLVTNGFSMSGTENTARRYMKAYVYWPVAFHPGPRRALLICYGLGSTAAALADTAELESIDVVDLSRDILEMGRLVDPHGRSHPLDDPRLRVHVEDGRFFLLTSQAEYDLITGEPPPPKNAGVVNLYTREYFELVRRRLAPGGIATWWLPVFGLDLGESRAIVQGFCSVFPDCSLWNGAGLNWMLAGGRGADYAPTEARLLRQWRDPVAAEELRAVGFESPAQLAATYIADARQLAEWARGVAPLVDDFPHRLSPRAVPLSDAARQHAPFMEARATRERFLESPWCARLGTDAVRDDAAAFFEFQGLANRAVLRAYGVPMPGRFRDLATALRRAPTPRIALNLMGSDADQQQVAARAARRGVTGGTLRYVQAVGAGALRDYATAEALLAEVQSRNPGSAEVV